MVENVLRVSLGADELVDNRTFTHPSFVEKDHGVLSHMAEQLGVVLNSHFDNLQVGQPVFIDEPDGRQHRYYVPDPTELMQVRRIFVVGFFGQVREGMSRDYFGDLDDMLTGQIPSFQGILSYSTMTLPDGNSSNLVLLTDEELKTKWAEGKIHQRAVALSPGYYKSVRINNGIFTDGIMQPDSFQITKVKYYDYQDDLPWKAIRRLN